MYFRRAKYGTSFSFGTCKIAVTEYKTGNVLTANRKRKEERKEEKKRGKKWKRGKEGRKEGRKGGKKKRQT